MQHIEETSEWIGQVSKAPNGHLRIKAPTIYTQWVIAPMLPQFLKTYPQLKIVVSISDDSRTDIVQQGIDLVVAVGPNHDSSLIRFPLGHSARKLYASNGYLDSKPSITKLEDLKDHPCLICAEPSPGYSWNLTHGSKTNKVSVSGPLVSTHYGPVAEAAKLGLGIALLPQRICEADIQLGLLVPVLGDWLCNKPEFNALIPLEETPDAKGESIY